MPRVRKKVAPPPSEHHTRWERVRHSVLNNLRVWIGAVSAAVVLGGYMITSWHWMSKQIDSFQTDEEAAAEYAKLRVEAQTEYAKMRAEMQAMVAKIYGDLKSYTTSAERNRLWLNVGQIRLEALILRNRVNECNSKKAVVDSSACEQYRDELKDAQERYNEAVKIAKEASR